MVRVVVGHLVGWAEHHAAVVGSHLQAGEGRLHFFANGLKAHVVAQQVQDVLDLDLTGIVALDEGVDPFPLLLVLAHELVRPLEHIVAGGAGRGHNHPAAVEGGTLIAGREQDVRRGGQLQHVVDDEGIGCAAAVPIGQLDQFQAHRRSRSTHGVVKALARRIQRTTRKIGYSHARHLSLSYSVYLRKPPMKACWGHSATCSGATAS